MLVPVIVAIIIVITGIATYPKWSYKEYYKSCLKKAEGEDGK